MVGFFNHLSLFYQIEFLIFSARRKRMQIMETQVLDNLFDSPLIKVFIHSKSEFEALH
jgi:hypothetical protein